MTKSVSIADIVKRWSTMLWMGLFLGLTTKTTKNVIWHVLGCVFMLSLVLEILPSHQWRIQEVLTSFLGT